MSKVRRPLRLLSIPILLIGLTATGLVSPAESAPAPIKCGAVITSNTTLTADVGPCSQAGVTIGADNITLNLNGFAVMGRASRTGDGIGVLINGRTDVTVTNGRVINFDAGVVIAGGSGNTVTGLLVKDNIGTMKSDFGDGILLVSSSNNDIIGNDVLNNGPFDGIGLFENSDSNTVEDNVVTANSLGFTGLDGIRVEGPSADFNVVTGNSVSGNTLDGIALFNGTGNSITDNDVTGNGYGHLGARPGVGIISFSLADGNTIQKNRVSDNAGSGVQLASGSHNNQVLENHVMGNARRGTTSFDLYDGNVTPTPCDNNTWLGNVFGTFNQACVTA